MRYFAFKKCGQSNLSFTYSFLIHMSLDQKIVQYMLHKSELKNLLSFHSWAWLKIFPSVDLKKYHCTAEHDKSGTDATVTSALINLGFIRIRPHVI